MTPMLSCSRFRSLYSAYRDGLLTPERVAAVQGHLDACERCRRRHHALEFGIRLLRATELRTAELPNHLRGDVLT